MPTALKIDFMKDCKKVRLGDIFIKLTRKNTENNTNVLTISAKYGLVNQEEFFSKSVASDNKSNYFLLYKGDFAYNKSYSNGYPFGAIKVLQRYEKGIVSPLYICFSPAPENYCPEFYLHYFESGLMNKAIRAIAQEGARNHGLLNIGIDDFFNISIPLPSLEIQQKIAKILSTQDKFIELKQKLVDRKKQQKKWLMQNLLTGKIRLKGFEGEWEKVKLGEIGSTYAGLSGKTKEDFGHGKAKYIPYINIFNNTFVDVSALEDIEVDEKQNCVKKGDVFFTTSSETPEEVGMSSVLLQDVENTYLNSFCFGYRPEKIFDSIFLAFMLRSDLIRKQFKILAQGISRFNISKTKAMEDISIYIPVLEEQTAIAKILSAQDKEIELLEKELEQEKLKKKALMQLLLTVK